PDRGAPHAAGPQRPDRGGAGGRRADGQAPGPWPWPPAPPAAQPRPCADRDRPDGGRLRHRRPVRWLGEALLMGAVVALDSLLASRRVWRAGQPARRAPSRQPTGHAALDAALPDGGWP